MITWYQSRDSRCNRQSVINGLLLSTC